MTQVGAKLGRFDRTVPALRIDKEGNLTQEDTSFRDLLLATEVNVRDSEVRSMGLNCRLYNCTPVWERGGGRIDSSRSLLGGLIPSSRISPLIRPLTTAHAHQVRDLITLAPDPVTALGTRTSPCILPRGGKRVYRPRLARRSSRDGVWSSS
jgi:hypothetical protein